MRAAAAFCVIYIHAPLVAAGAPIQANAQWVASFFQFAVPFFLLTAFYFGAQASQKTTTWKAIVHKSAKRLLIPYLLWTGIYIALRMVKFWVQHKSMWLVFADPVGLLMGGSAVHLYFIPLLFIGLVTQQIIAPGIRKFSAVGVLFLLALSLTAKIAVIRSGNGFNLDPMRAFETLIDTRALGLADAPARLALIFLSHVVRCLPLVLLGFLLARFLARVNPGVNAGNKPQRFAILLLASALFALQFALPLQHSPLGDEISGVLAFLLAWALSAYIPENKLARNLGVFSYGVYLSHLVFLETLQVGATKLHIAPRLGSFPALFAVSALTFLACWLTLSLASRQGKQIRLLAGLE